MFDLNEVIIPGSELAGIKIGTHIDNLADVIRQLEKVEVCSGIILDEYEAFSSSDLRVVFKKSLLSGIVVYDTYKGKFKDSIAIGSSIRDIKNLGYRVEENEEDEFEIVGISGLCFDLKCIEGIDSEEDWPISTISVLV